MGLRLKALAELSTKEMHSMTAFIHLFVGGTTGKWRVERASALTGPALAPVPRLAILDGSQTSTPVLATWPIRSKKWIACRCTCARSDLLSPHRLQFKQRKKQRTFPFLTNNEKELDSEAAFLSPCHLLHKHRMSRTKPDEE